MLIPSRLSAAAPIIYRQTAFVFQNLVDAFDDKIKAFSHNVRDTDPTDTLYSVVTFCEINKRMDENILDAAHKVHYNVRTCRHVVSWCVATHWKWIRNGIVCSMTFERDNCFHEMWVCGRKFSIWHTKNKRNKKSVSWTLVRPYFVWWTTFRCRNHSFSHLASRRGCLRIISWNITHSNCVCDPIIFFVFSSLTLTIILTSIILNFAWMKTFM